jgi:hypothetical protein
MLSILVKLSSYIVLIGVTLIRYKFSTIGCFKRLKGKGSNTCLILMNGPSLLSDISRFERDNNLNEVDFIVANHFADTEYFVKYKPKFYVFSDPYFFQQEASSDLRKKSKKTFVNIANNTTWKMTILVPAHYDIRKFSTYFSSNSQISIIKFNGSGYLVEPSKFLFFLWKFNLCSPFPQSVLIHALYSAIQLKYKRIILTGANFSFHTSILVDQQSNDFYKLRKHVYGEEKELAYTSHQKIKKANLSSEFFCIYRGFHELSSLEKFSKLRKVQVYNYTNYSYLDMFKRPEE